MKQAGPATKPGRKAHHSSLLYFSQRADSSLRGYEKMPNIELNGKSIETDEDGYLLLSTDDWSENVAQYLAKTVGIEDMTKEALGRRQLPQGLLRRVQDRSHDQGSDEAMAEKMGEGQGRRSPSTLYELFPGGPAKDACKIAGLSQADGPFNSGLKD